MGGALQILFWAWLGGALATAPTALGVAPTLRARLVLIVFWPLVAAASLTGLVSWSGSVSKD